MKAGWSMSCVAGLAALLLAGCQKPVEKPAGTPGAAPEQGAGAPPAANATTKENQDMTAGFIPWPDNDPRAVTLASGLRYIVLASGPEGGLSPRPTDRVEVQYEGRVAATGEKFDSSFDRGQSATFPAGRLIRGWVEALQLMKPGDDWVLYIPTDLGYGQNPRPGGVIKPGDDLVFRVQMLDVIVMPTADEAAWAKHTPWNPDSPDVVKTDSGVQYIVLTPAPEGARKPAASDQVVVHYEGRLAADGSFFDSSFSRGEPAMFGVSQVIPGWTEMLQLMGKGERVLVYIPSDLAYGARGTPGGPIPPNADLIFEVELVDVLTVR